MVKRIWKKYMKKVWDSYSKIYIAPTQSLSRKAVFVFPWLLYNTPSAAWILPDIINAYEATFVFFDYPESEFNLDTFIDEVYRYIEDSLYEEIVLIWLSFWCIVTRHLLDKIPVHIKYKIKHVISISGPSTNKELSIWYKTMLKACHRNSLSLNKAVWYFGYTIKFLNKIFTKLEIQRLSRMWLNRGYVDRARYILHEKNLHKSTSLRL